MQFRLEQRYLITHILVKLITCTNGNIIPINKQCKQITCFFSFSDVNANTHEHETTVIKLLYYAKLAGKFVSIKYVGIYCSRVVRRVTFRELRTSL